MGADNGRVPDWRDGAAYEPLVEVDRSFIAWEWLRRDPAYRAAAERSLGARGSPHRGDPFEPPRRWGLQLFECPWRPVPEARPMWRSEVHPDVLGVIAAAPVGDDLFDLERFASIATLAAANGREHLLISDGIRAIRIDVLEGTLRRGPAQLRYRLAGLAAAERSARTLSRFLALHRTGAFSRSLHPAEARARRWLMLLRTHDALVAGANQLQIATGLLGDSGVGERWRVEAPSLRSRVQRLVRGARQMADGGFWELLR